MSEYHLPDGWFFPNDPQFFMKQLQLEVGPSHIMDGKELTFLGYNGLDDILVKINNDESASFAIVHLTFGGPQRPPWPSTTMFRSWAEYRLWDVERNEAVQIISAVDQDHYSCEIERIRVHREQHQSPYGWTGVRDLMESKGVVALKIKCHLMKELLNGLVRWESDEAMEIVMGWGTGFELIAEAGKNECISRMWFSFDCKNETDVSAVGTVLLKLGRAWPLMLIHGESEILLDLKDADAIQRFLDYLKPDCRSDEA